MVASEQLQINANFVDVDAEMCTIGAAILWEESATDVLRICQPEHFYVPAHTLILKTIQDLRNEGTVVDLVSVRDRLGVKGAEAVGGVEYLVECSEKTWQAWAVSYAETVRKKFDLREMDRKLMAAARAVRAGDFINGVLLGNDVTQGVYSRANVVDPETAIAEAKKGLRPGIPTFLPSLNQFWKAGGFGPGRFHGYCAESGKGKSTFLCQQAVYCLEFGLKIGIVSLEMDLPELLIKMLQQMTGCLSENDAAVRGQDVLEAYQEAFARVRHWLDSGDLAVMDQADDGATASQVFAWMDAQARANGTEFFIVDYVQDIKPEPNQKADYAFHHNLSSQFRLWARSTGICVLGLFQVVFNKDGFAFKGGDMYRQDCYSIILKVFGKKDESGHQDEFLVIAKNRAGRLGKIQVFYNPLYDAVSEWLGGR